MVTTQSGWPTTTSSSPMRSKHWQLCAHEPRSIALDALGILRAKQATTDKTCAPSHEAWENQTFGATSHKEDKKRPPPTKAKRQFCQKAHARHTISHSNNGHFACSQVFARGGQYS
eukprot:4276617-Amphidinium_carterae.1